MSTESERLRQLWDFYNTDPEDPLNLYLLGLEYRQSDPARSKELLLRLLHEHPDYLPGYYITAELLHASGDADKAIKVLEQGLTLAMKSGNKKTASEIQNLLNEIRFDSE